MKQQLVMASLVALILVAMATEVWTLKETELTCTLETLQPCSVMVMRALKCSETKYELFYFTSYSFKNHFHAGDERL